MTAILFIRPIDWKGVRDRRYGEEAMMKGDFGEYIVKDYLESKGLKLEKQERKAQRLPDFKVQNKPIFIEVKTHKTKKPPVWQRKNFISLASIGWKIYIAHPRIIIGKATVICTEIRWYEFLNSGKLKRLNVCPVN